MNLDDRLKVLRNIPRPTKPQQCIICRLFKKPLRKGRCHACNEYYRKRGKERSEICLNLKKK